MAPANPSIDLVTELKNFKIASCCKVKDEKGKLRDSLFSRKGKIYCKVCRKVVGDVARREAAFHQIFKYFLPTIYNQLKKLKYTNKVEAVQFIRLQLFRIVDNRNLRMDNGKQLTMYISGTLDKRINNDHFKGTGDGTAESHCIKGLFVQQYSFRFAKKRYIKKFRKEPDLRNDSDLKELAKIYNGNKEEVMTISNNLNNAMESLEKKIPFDKNGNAFKLADVLPSELESPEQDCIISKNSEIILERLKLLLTPEQAELMRLYYLDPQEMTKEAIAEKLGWKRHSKSLGKEILDTSKVKNNLDTSIHKLEKDPILRELFTSM
jgi:hypothetical protein